MSAATHEAFIASVAGIVAARQDEETRKAIESVKLVYGAGSSGLRGITYYNRWKAPGAQAPAPFVEVCAFGQENWIQLAGTTIHELAHVTAGHEAGHAKAWKDQCTKLGLRLAKAAGHSYNLASFDPELRQAIAALPRPNDGEPVTAIGSGLIGLGPQGLITMKPCGAGIGTRGGKSHGPGSGSRLIRVSCGQCGYVARVARKWLENPGAPHCPDHGEMVEGGAT
jgi:hypothetical protein